MEISKKQFAKMIDYTLIKPTATRNDVEKLCKEAEKYGFGCVCVNSMYVLLAKQLLRDMDVKVCSTVGFPFGATLPEVKAFEAEKAVEKGVQEIDMVINIGALKSGDYETVKKDIGSVVAVKRSHSDLVIKVIIETVKKDIETVVNVKGSHSDLVIKVIIETGYLTTQEKIMACRLAKEAGADFVKTSTGLVGGATVEDVKLMRETVGKDMGVKAAGG
ncbi:MAG: deoxyribose-phosphate aldolase, partial [Candidatus Bathyarchaeia archaeon]